MIVALKNWLLGLGFTNYWAEMIKLLIVIIAVFFIAYLANCITKKFISIIVSRIVRHTKVIWDDIMLKNKVFHRFSHLIPALFIYYIAPYALKGHPHWIANVKSLVFVYFIIIAILILSAFLTSLNEIYMKLPSSKDRPIKGPLQIVNIFNYMVGIILILSIILHKNPAYFLTGIGAFTAVLMLVFKDSLLGLVAGIQLCSNEMVKLGDWISMPSKGIDGTIIEITLITVKVQNWDKTISMIPAYSLISESFINYRGMEEANARRIKRSLFIDINTVRFLTLEEIESLKKISLIKNYLDNKLAEIEKYNQSLPFDVNNPVNGKWLTNIGTFRMYALEYIKSLPHIRKDLSYMVRQVSTTESGVALEVYAFTSITEWEAFEKAQADIFDHLMAVVPMFYLHLYQNPTGNDFSRVVSLSQKSLNK